jgi:sterol desaturase/sphingolipid hydroxylase (fatty acid hydroxylase superfamily)
MWLGAAKWAVGGLSITPFLDYAWHAWIAHGRRANPTRDEHLEHHRTAHTEGDKWGEIRNNAPRIGLASLAVTATLTPFVGVGRALGLATGLACGYVAITLSHARMHERAPRNAREEWMWRFHFHHHYGNAKKNFGLTSPLFDIVFGTLEMPDQVALPRGVLPAWWAGDHRGFSVRRRGAASHS